MQAIDGSLRRMQLDFIDLVYCHRPDPKTPIEETVWAMSDMIARGKALYWGTSEWSAADIRAAWDIADRHHLHKPVMEQPQYHLFHRKRVEQEYARLYDDIGLGLTTWSPLASGLLTGKYKSGIPAGSRGALENMGLLAKGLTDEAKNAAVAKLEGDRRRARRDGRAAGDRLGREEPARLDGDHRRLERGPAARQPRRGRRRRQADARGARAHRRHRLAARGVACCAFRPASR